MPTGYTAAVGDGTITTLRQFALTCARGMGAAIQMRDDPRDKAIPERFEPQTKYHDDRLAEARKVLADVPLLTDAECDARAEAEHAQRLADHNKYEAERAAENDRYRTMLHDVRGWKTDAEGIRDFMIQQLEVSISDYVYKPPEKLTGMEWRREAIEKAAEDVGYHEKERAKEIGRTEERNRWLAALRASLPPETTATWPLGSPQPANYSARAQTQRQPKPPSFQHGSKPDERRVRASPAD